MRRNLALLLVPFALAACGDRQDAFDEYSAPHGPYPVGNRVVYIDSAQERLFTLDLSTDPMNPGVAEFDIPADATYVMTLPDRKAIVWQEPDGLLTVFYPENGSRDEYALTAPFNKYSYAPEQALLACYFGGSVSTTGGQLVNKGQVAFVDLSKPGSVVEKVLPTYGGEPLGIEMAPIAGNGGRSLALVRWVSFVSLLDARDASFVPIAIPTKAPNSESDMIPGPVQFHLSGGVLRCWFLDSARGDLYQLSVDLAALAPGGEGVGVNIFPAIKGATMFAPFTTHEGTTALLAVSPYQSTVAVVYPDTSLVDLYELDIQPSDVRIFAGGGLNGSWALLSDPSGWTQAYYVANLDKLAELKSKAFKKYALPAPATQLLPLDGGTRFLALHYFGEAGVLSVITTLDGSAVTLGSSKDYLRDWVYFEDQGLFFALLDSSSSRSLLRLDTNTMLQTSMSLQGLATDNTIRHSSTADWLLLPQNGTTDLLAVPGDFESAEDAILVTAPEWNGLVE